MRDFTLTSSDHVLAQGLKFWTSVMEDHQIEELDQSYQIITALQEFLKTFLRKNQIKSDDEYDDQTQALSSVKEETKTDLYDCFNVIEMPDDVLVDISIAKDENSGKTEGKTKEEDYEETDKENPIIAATPEIIPSGVVVEDESDSEIKQKESKISGSQTCEHCDEMVSSLNDLGKHIASHHEAFLDEFEQKYKKYRCEDCSFKSYTLRRWYKHQKAAHALLWQENKEKSFHCGECGTDFIGINRFKKHSLCHEVCHLCSKVLYGKKHLKKHLEKHLEKHNEPKRPKVSELCSICGKRFKSMSYHRKKEHGLENGMNCRFCNLAFDTGYLRQTHEFKVHNSKAEICTLCGKKIKKSYLDKHMSSHTEANRPCELCGKVFKTLFHLERHHKVVHISDEEKPLKCSSPGCMRAFVNSQSLESHLNSHLGLKPYPCSVCETRFQNPSNRIAHLRNVHKIFE